MDTESLRLDEIDALSNEAISTEIAKIEELNVIGFEDNILSVINKKGRKVRFEPLTNDGQTLKLMTKHNVTRLYEPCDQMGFHYGVYESEAPQRFLSEEYGDNKAICLAIIYHYRYGVEKSLKGEAA
jgi:hypothetical protein